MQATDYKKYLPHLLIILGFLVLSFIYCYPQLQGKMLRQGDIISWKGMAHEGMEWHEKTGENVLWSNSMFGGMPTYAFYVPMSNNYTGIVTTIIQEIGKPAYFFFFALVCFYILMQVLGFDRWLSVIGAVAYAFSTYNAVIITAGHDTKMMALGYLPAAMAGLLLLYRGKWWPGAALWCYSAAMMFNTNHFQIIYYSFIIFGFAAIGIFFMARKEHKLKVWVTASVIAAITGALAIAPDMASFLSQKEYAKQTMRGGASEQTLTHDKQKKNGGLDKSYAFQWSNAVGETFCTIVPYLYGGSSDQKYTGGATYDALTRMNVPEDQANAICEQLPMYWGPQPFLSGPAYFGAVICFLFALGMIIIKSPHKWWIASVCAVAIMMSWGKHFPALNYFLFDHLPLYNNFRIPAMIMVIPEFLFPVLAIWAVNDVLTTEWQPGELWKKVRTAAIITGGLCLVLGLGGRMFFDYRNDQNDAEITQRFVQMTGGNKEAAASLVRGVHEDRATMATNSSLISALYIALAAGLIWAYSKKSIKKPVLIAGLGLLVAIDLFSVDTHYLSDKDFVDSDEYDAAFQPRPVDVQIMQDKDPYYRVLDLSVDVYNNAIQAYFHKCVGGYSAAKLEIYQDLIDLQLGGRQGKFNAQVLNMLNTKYIIANPNNPVVFPNPDACGNAWFVSNIKWAPDANAELLGLNANALGDTTKMPNAFNPKTTAVIRETFKNELNGYNFGKDSSATVKLAKYGLDDIYYASNNSKDGLAVFSDIWYPEGWEAYIDGKQTNIIRANYVLRALKIPAGRHNIEFRFHPKSFYTGNTISLFGSILVWGLVITAIAQGFRKGKEPEQKAHE